MKLGLHAHDMNLYIVCVFIVNDQLFLPLWKLKISKDVKIGNILISLQVSIMGKFSNSI